MTKGIATITLCVAAITLLFAAKPVQPPGQSSVIAYKIVDANGAVVGVPFGIEAGSNQGLGIRESLQGIPFTFRFSPSSISGQWTSLWYESSDCSGTPYLNAQFVPVGGVYIAGSGTLFGPTTDQPVQVTILSTWNGTNCSTTSFSAAALPAAASLTNGELAFPLRVVRQ